MSLKRSVFLCSLVWWFSTLRFSGCSSSPWQHLLHSQYTSCLFFLHFPRQSNVKVPPSDLSSTPAHRIYHYTHRLNNPTYNSCTIHAVSPVVPSIVWYGWKRCYKYICFLRPRIVATPTHAQHTPWMQYTVCRVLHQESSLNLTKEHGSIFATCKDWRIWSRGGVWEWRRKTYLWAPWGESRPLWLYPCGRAAARDMHRFHSPGGNREKTHLIHDITTLHIPDTHHSVSSSDGCTTPIVIFTPCGTQ